MQMILRDIIEKSSHQFNFYISFFYTGALDASSQKDKHLTGTGTRSYVKLCKQITGIQLKVIGWLTAVVLIIVSIKCYDDSTSLSSHNLSNICETSIFNITLQ